MSNITIEGVVTLRLKLQDKNIMNVSKKKKVIIFSMISAVISCISYVATMTTGDIAVLLAGARQAEYIGNSIFFINVVKQWDLKGVLMRTFIYALYAFASLFKKYGTTGFLGAVKIECLIFIILLSTVTARIWFKKKDDIFIALSVILLGVCSTFPSSHVQAEPVCAVLCLLAFAVLNKAIEKKNILLLVISGMIIGMLFFFKSVLIILAVSVVMAELLWNKRKVNREVIVNIFCVALSSIGILAMGLVGIYLVNPDEIENIVNASKYQNTLFSVGITLNSLELAVYNFFGEFVTVIYMYPILLFGTILGEYQIVCDIKRKQITTVAHRFVMWLTPAVFVILSNCYFQYHYSIFIFPSIIEIMIFVKKIEIKDEKFIKIPKMIYAMFFVLSIVMYITGRIKPSILYKDYSILINPLIIILLLAACIVGLFYKKALSVLLVLSFMLCFEIFANYTSSISDFNVEAKRISNTCDELDSHLNIDKAATCLYLDDGGGAWHLGIRSALPAYYPLPLQRISEGSPYENLEAHVQAKRQALNYRGMYVSVSDGWFFNGKNQEIYDKVKSEYALIDEIATYSLSWNIFSRPSERDIQYYQLYIRKQ